jgi:hypothetical protein
MDSFSIFARVKQPLWQRFEEYRRRQETIPPKNQALIDLLTAALEIDEEEKPAK